MKLKHIFSKLTVITFILIFGMLVSFSVDAAPIILRLGHIDTVSSPMGQGAEKFKEIVENRTDGEIQIHVFPSEQLGAAAAMVEDVIDGTIELYLENPATFQDRVPAQAIHFAKYVYRDRDHLRQFIKSDLYDEVFTKPMEEIGIKYLSEEHNWERGPVRLFISKKPIFTPEDLKGVKLRLWDSTVPIKIWETFGVSCTILPWSEIYLALMTGTVDAVTASGGVLWANKFTEVIKYVTLLKQQQQLIDLHMNLEKYNSLSSEHQQILVDAAYEAGEYFTSLVNNNWEMEKQKMMDEHGAVFIEVSIKPFMEIVKPILYELEDEGYWPKGLYDSIQAIGQD